MVFGFDFDRLRSGPFEGPAIVKPPAMPGDTYYRATLLAQTKAAFISKISIVIEEADESEFWLEFIIDERLLEKDKVFSLLNEAHELTSIFIVSRRTAQKRVDD